MSALFYRFLPTTFPTMLVCVFSIYTVTKSLTKIWIHHAYAEKGFLIHDVFIFASPQKKDIWACLGTTRILLLSHHCFFQRFPWLQWTSNLLLHFTIPNLPFRQMELASSWKREDETRVIQWHYCKLSKAENQKEFLLITAGILGTQQISKLWPLFSSEAEQWGYGPFFQILVLRIELT